MSLTSSVRGKRAQETEWVTAGLCWPRLAHGCRSAAAGAAPAPVIVWAAAQVAASLDHTAQHDPHLHPIGLSYRDV